MNGPGWRGEEGGRFNICVLVLSLDFVMNFVALLRNTDGGTYRTQATVAGVASLRITIFPKAKYFSVFKKILNLINC